MTKLKRTNSKEYRDRIYKATLEAIEFPDLDQDTQDQLTDRQKLEYFLNQFDREKGHAYNLKRFPNRQDRLADWLQGLPSTFNVPFANHEVLEFAKALHGVDKLSEKQEEVILDNYWHHLAQMILSLNEKLSK